MKGTIFGLSGRAELVTGGSRGLGEAMAEIFAQAGAEVMITSRHASQLQTAAAHTARQNRPCSGWPGRRPSNKGV
jgi:NAD(P)-dependent dehydrogenase (short-subunit alcohol dehydrogenase family)